MSQTAAVQDAISNNKVVVFSKTYCPYCTRAKKLLSDLNVPHMAIELDKVAGGSEMQSALQGITNIRTVPQVFVGGKLVGGCDDTVAAHSSGKLKQLLDGVGIAV